MTSQIKNHGENMKGFKLLSVLVIISLLSIIGCSDDSPTEPKNEPKDPNTAAKVSVDRFSSTAGNLFVRNGSNLPAANEPIKMDEGPFITTGLGPNGQVVKYYNFDVMSSTPAPIFVLFKDGAEMPVDGQLNIINVIPGEAGYNDFWHVQKVTVPNDYIANTVTSLSEINDAGYSIEATDILVNCPVVPEGSTANLKYGGGSSTLVRGWYKGEVVFYFSFEEKMLSTAPASPLVPISPIYVTFNINPNQTGGGPASGFVMEQNSLQTHNVVETIPTDAAYSPLWLVNVYDNSNFGNVSDLISAKNSTILGQGVALVNCPIVSIQ